MPVLLSTISKLILFPPHLTPYCVLNRKYLTHEFFHPAVTFDDDILLLGQLNDVLCAWI